MKQHFNWITTILIVVTLICTFGCKHEAEIPKDTTPPAEVTNLVATASNGNAVITWTNPTDEDFAYVQLSMEPAEGTLANPIFIRDGISSFSISGLTVGKEYTFTVKTVDSSLNPSTGVSTTATVSDTSDKTPPSK